MLFQPQLCRMILTGRKTETRRTVKPGKAGAQPSCFYRVGVSYPLERPLRLDEADQVQAEIILGNRRGRPPKKEIARILITAVEQRAAGEVTSEDARQEGFTTPNEFRAYWVRLHDKAWLRRQAHDPHPGIGAMPEPPTDEQLLERFEKRHADRRVWVIRFQLEPSIVYLAADPISAGGDYVTTERDRKGRLIAMTTQSEVDLRIPDTVPAADDPSDEVEQDRRNTLAHAAMTLEPEEAVHPAVIDSWRTDTTSTHHRLQAHGHTTEAHQRDVERRLHDAGARISERVRDAKKTARDNGINVAPAIKALRRAQESSSTADDVEEPLRTLEHEARGNEASHAA
jgi:hypothetical protein